MAGCAVSPGIFGEAEPKRADHVDGNQSCPKLGQNGEGWEAGSEKHMKDNREANINVEKQANKNKQKQRTPSFFLFFDRTKQQ